MEWLVLTVAGLLLWLRQSLLIWLAVSVLLLYALFENGRAEYVIYDLWDALNRDTLLALPVFALAHGLMIYGVSADRLAELLTQLCRGLPAGLALACLLAMALVSGLVGSPAIAVLVLGSTLHRALLRDGYPSSFAIGLLCASSVIGVLLPLSIPAVVYSVVGQVELQVLLRDAASVAAFLLVLLSVYCLLSHWSRRSASASHDQLVELVLQAAPALVAVGVLCIGFASNALQPVHVGVLYLVAAGVAELGVYRQIDAHDLLAGSQDLVRQMGRTLPVILFSVSLSLFLASEQIPQLLAGRLALGAVGPAEFLAFINLLLLALGLVLDTLSALLLVTPVVAPLGDELGLAQGPFAVMVVLNLAIACLSPPNGLVLVAAMVAFRDNFQTVLGAVAPFLGLLWIAVLIAALAAL